MKAKLAGLILFMGASMAVQARTHTFALDDEVQDARAAMHFAAGRVQVARATFDRGQVIKVHHRGDGDADDAFCGPIPEPGTYAMLLAGLGLMTTIARRKRMDR